MRLYVASSAPRLLIWIDALREQSTSTLALHPDEVMFFTQMFDYIAAVNGGRESSGQIVPNEHHIEALIHVLDRWPTIHRFPRARLFLHLSIPRDLTLLSCSYRPCPAHRGLCPPITAHETRTRRPVHGCSSEGIRLGRALDSADDKTEREKHFAASQDNCKCTPGECEIREYYLGPEGTRTFLRLPRAERCIERHLLQTDIHGISPERVDHVIPKDIRVDPPAKVR